MNVLIFGKAKLGFNKLRGCKKMLSNEIRQKQPHKKNVKYRHPKAE